MLENCLILVAYLLNVCISVCIRIVRRQSFPPRIVEKSLEYVCMATKASWAINIFTCKEATSYDQVRAAVLKTLTISEVTYRWN